jgi:HD-GYP domain-containing protein (c-di-GMP phosphodiesterase class II)
VKDIALIISNSDKGALLSNSDIVKLKGIDLIKCDTLAEGIEILKEQKKINLIISNYTFKDGKASTIFQYLNHNALFIPVIIVLDEGEITLRTQAFIDGACAVFTQPLSESYLLLTAANLLNLTKTQAQLKASESVIEALSKSLEYKDNLTIGHAKRVADFSVMLYDELGFKDLDKRYELYIGSLLHDIGKIGIPDYILKSDKVYTKDSFEFEELKKHSVMGFEMSKQIQEERVLEIILNHHEKLDGSGYPRGLLAKDISTVVRIVSIIDIFDSLVHKRSYRDPMLLEKAFDILLEEAEAGKISYDITKVFIEMMKRKGFTIETLDQTP